MRHPDLSPTQFTLGTFVATALGLLGLGFLVWGSWIPLKAQLAQVLLERAWQQSRLDGLPHRAWPWADSWPVAKLKIPALSFEAIILKEAGGEGLAFGPVLLDQSAPLGTRGTTVIAAHRDTHFKALANLRMGMQLVLEPMDGPALTYMVDKNRIARWDQSGLVKNTLASSLVLASCWPFDAMTSGPMRFIAEASPSRATAKLIQ
nr:class GN sortase [uncultured Cohaesibacter sp.]